MLSSPKSRAACHSSRPRLSATPRAMRFHISGELSSQNRPAWVWSGVRSLGVVTPSPPSLLTSSKSSAYGGWSRGMVRRADWRAAQHEGPDVAPPRCESERRISVKRHSPGAVPCGKSKSWSGVSEPSPTRRARMAAADAGPTRSPPSWRDRGGSGPAPPRSRLRRGDAGVATRLWKRRGNLRDRRDQDVTRRGGNRGVRRSARGSDGVEGVRTRTALDRVQRVVDGHVHHRVHTRLVERIVSRPRCKPPARRRRRSHSSR